MRRLTTSPQGPKPAILLASLGLWPWRDLLMYGSLNGGSGLYTHAYTAPTSLSTKSPSQRLLHGPSIDCVHTPQSYGASATVAAPWGARGRAAEQPLGGVGGSKRTPPRSRNMTPNKAPNHLKVCET